MLMTIMPFLDKHEKSTFKRMSVVPVGKGTVVLGKIIPQLIISYIQITVLFLFGFVVFGVRIGNAGAFAIVTFALSMTIARLGTLLASPLRSRNQAGGISTIISITLGALGGTMLPAWISRRG